MKKSFLITFLFAGAAWCAQAQKNMFTPYNNKIVAHRGAWKANHLPENSIASLKQAIALKCAGSEFDVHLTADDSLVINHDPTYQGLTIATTTYAELAKKKLSNGETIPTLQQYIAAGMQNNNGTLLVLEVKPFPSSPERALRCAEKSWKLVRAMGAASRTVYISFDYEVLKKIRSLDAKAIVQYLNGEKTPAELKQDKIDGADYHFSVFKKNEGWIKELRNNKQICNAWTVNDAAEMDWLLANNVDYITTNEPELLATRIAVAPVNKGWKLVWSDEFFTPGLPDSTKWSYNVGDHGWGNHEKQYYSNADTANAINKNGVLHIIARRDNATGKYSSARMVTKGKGDWLYGRVEVRAKIPAGKGLWPAIWMLPTEWAYGGWPKSGEIDIMEHVGYMPDSVFTSIHTESFNHVIHTQKTKGFSLPDMYDAFHVYAIEWKKERIDFFVDDVLRFSFDNTGKGSKEWPFDKAFHLLLNVAVGGDWGGKHGIDDAIFPQSMQVDYVRVYQ
ncbi:MAG: family 16 glycosylhydrolase [Filimonas sp.]|nr:family 16 glycosylhydrolase [Filimonas sp.]